MSDSTIVLFGRRNTLFLDITPLSLSIETVGGIVASLVERNTTLPIHYSQIFSTAVPYLKSVEINVLQGERPMARDNKFIGEFKLNGIKATPTGVPQIEVTFDIDANIILKIFAKDLDTEKEQSITSDDNERMSDAEIQQAIRDAEIYASQDRICRKLFEVNTERQTKQLQKHKKRLRRQDKNVYQVRNRIK